MAEKPGLQIQRTQLAWERSAISFIAVGGVLLFHPYRAMTWDRLVLSSLAVAMALLALWVGRVRHGIDVRTDTAGLPVVRVPARAVAVIGWGTAILAIAVVALVVFG